MENQSLSAKVYPSIDELLPLEMLVIIPDNLAREIIERYETLGPKYLTDNLTEDGRQINGMMYTDRIVNCIEEIVDAVFCIVGQIFKDTSKGAEPSQNLYTILDGLIQIYKLLSMEKIHGNYF